MTTVLQTTAVVIQLPAFSKEIAIQSAWLEKRNAAVATAAAIVKVESQADYDAATEALARVSKLDSGIEKMRKELTAPFLAAQRTIKEKVDEACVPLQEHKARLKTLTGAWFMAEQKRIAAEAAERELKEREAAEEALALQEEARQQAEALGLDAPAAEDLVTVVAPVEQAPKSDSASVQMRIDAEIVDESKVPRAFCMADIRLINAYKKDNKADLEKRIAAGEGETVIAGVRFTLRPDVMGR